MYILHIANKNYSSWSLRPWALMRQLDIAFEERLTPFAEGPRQEAFHAFSPTAQVPCLVDGSTTVWESIAIVEYLAERHAGVWPQDATQRAFARSASAEMHAGFRTLRTICTMNCGLRVELRGRPPGLEGDLFRLDALWSEGLARFGGPFLAGRDFSAIDAFFAPVAFRAQTYGLRFGAASTAYLARLRDLSACRAWYDAALAETMREEDHEAEARAAGVITADLRAVRHD